MTHALIPHKQADGSIALMREDGEMLAELTAYDAMELFNELGGLVSTREGD